MLQRLEAVEDQQRLAPGQQLRQVGAFFPGAQLAFRRFRGAEDYRKAGSLMMPYDVLVGLSVLVLRDVTKPPV